jgi:tRNA C32,U32 (ribose-2'-O)-methylase TrmJ
MNATHLPQYQHPDNAFCLFGPEDGTLSQEVIDAADAVVYMPAVGCMNLAATVNVLLYDRMVKAAQHVGSNELIRQSRDRNNNVKIRRTSNGQEKFDVRARRR